MRKIIQISTSVEPGAWPFIVALCDDGTLWAADVIVGKTMKWEQLTPTPQDDAEAGK